MDLCKIRQLHFETANIFWQYFKRSKRNYIINTVSVLLYQIILIFCIKFLHYCHGFQALYKEQHCVMGFTNRNFILHLNIFVFVTMTFGNYTELNSMLPWYCSNFKIKNLMFHWFCLVFFCFLFFFLLIYPYLEPKFGVTNQCFYLLYISLQQTAVTQITC